MIVDGFKIDRCRGLESRIMDGSSDITVIKAPVTEVSKAVTQLYSEAQVHANAFERVIQANNRGIILFQFKGFEWTIVYGYRRVSFPTEVELSKLSGVLRTRAMFLSITDTAFYVYHHVCDNGKSVEHFLFDDEVIKLESQIRKVDNALVAHDALNDFYKEQGVYFPYIKITSEPTGQDNASAFRFKAKGEFDWCLEQQFKDISSEDCLKSYPLERNDFEGFDYITFEE